MEVEKHNATWYSQRKYYVYSIFKQTIWYHCKKQVQPYIFTMLSVFLFNWGVTIVYIKNLYVRNTLLTYIAKVIISLSYQRRKVLNWEIVLHLFNVVHCFSNNHNCLDNIIVLWELMKYLPSVNDLNVGLKAIICDWTCNAA